jgi:hypothetical protein
LVVVVVVVVVFSIKSSSLVEHLGSAKQTTAQQEMEHLGKLVLEQQDAEEVAV